MKRVNTLAFIFTCFLPAPYIGSATPSTAGNLDLLSDEKIYQAANYMYYGYTEALEEHSSASILLAWWLDPATCSNDVDLLESQSGSMECFGYQFFQTSNKPQAFRLAEATLPDQPLEIYGLSWSDTFQSDKKKLTAIKVYIGIPSEGLSRSFLFLQDDPNDPETLKVLDIGYSPHLFQRTKK